MDIKGSKMFKMLLVTCLISIFILPALVVAEEPNVTIHLQIEADSTLFDGELVVEACSAFEGATEAVSGYCAIQQSGLESAWSSFGDDRFLSSIGDFSNDYDNNIYWGWFSNLEYGQTSLNKHILAPNEYLLVTLNRMPLKMLVSTSSPMIGATTTVTVYKFGFDDAWNPAWIAAASSTVRKGEQAFETDANGIYDLPIENDASFSLYAIKEGFLNSEEITITPFSSTTEVAEATTKDIATTSESLPAQETGEVASGGSGGVVITHATVDVAKAVAFLISKQKEDGSFGSSLYTDWVAVALAAYDGSEVGGAREKVATYIKNNPGALSTATDFERRAMSLMALGVNPYNGTPINYIQKIIETFDGSQIGDPDLVNDDIFAIFPLLKAGYTTNDDIIQKIAAFIMTNQQANGSFENSVDLTAAATQALHMVQGVEGVTPVLQSARQYLVTHQQDNGGFGTSFGTSWTMQAIAALGEDATSWLKNNKNPADFLAALQQADGGIEAVGTNDDTRIWATSYAIPASLNKPWSALLSSFSKVAPVVTANQQNLTPSSSPLFIPQVKTASSSVREVLEVPLKKLIEEKPVQVRESVPDIVEETAEVQKGEIVEVANESSNVAAIGVAEKEIPKELVYSFLGFSIALLIFFMIKKYV